MPPRVLVVEPTPRLPAVLPDEWDVRLAPDGERALARLRAGERPDLIVLDIQRAGIDARTFFRRIRKLNVATPVVLLSARTVPRSLQREPGAAGVLQRSWDDRFLVQQLTVVLASLLVIE